MTNKSLEENGKNQEVILMKNKKKFMAGILVLLLALSMMLLSACHGSKSDASSDSKESQDGSEIDRDKESDQDDNSGEETSDKNAEAYGEAETDLTWEEKLEADCKEKARELLDSMNLEEKIYQMFIVTPEAMQGIDVTGDQARFVTVTDGDTEEGCQMHPVGGLIYFSENMIDPEQVKELTETIQSYSQIPLFISTDEEGGPVARLMDQLGTSRLDAMFTYKEKGPETAKKNAKIIAADMKELGFNLDFAPVADVWSNPENTVIATRAYSDDYEEAATLVAGAVEGFQEENMLCTLKHFPGHGDTSEDSHTGNAYVTKTLDEIRGQELKTFQAGIHAGADLIMVGHMITSKIDPEGPASLSKTIVTDLLKDELGYQGLVITDALNMGAIANIYSSGEAAVMAVQAGVDILLMPYNLENAADALMEAVQDGDISKERIDESVEKILLAKCRCGIINME